jgi:hypothetical protein
VLDKALSDDRSHHLARVVLPLAAVEAQRERLRVGDIFGRGGCEATGSVGYGRDRNAG